MHILVATLLGGTMRWDIRHPEKRFGDRFVLGVGHTIPLIYCTLAVLNEALRIKYTQTGDNRYAIPGGGPELSERTRNVRCSGRICWASGAAEACRATPRWAAKRSS